MSQLFNHEEYSGTPTLERIFEGPTEEQVTDYIKSLKCVPNTDGRSSTTDTEMLNYLQNKYQVETNNPDFDIRVEVKKHMKEERHASKKRSTTTRLV